MYNVARILVHKQQGLSYNYSLLGLNGKTILRPDDYKANLYYPLFTHQMTADSFSEKSALKNMTLTESLDQNSEVNCAIPHWQKSTVRGAVAQAEERDQDIADKQRRLQWRVLRSSLDPDTGSTMY